MPCDASQLCLVRVIIQDEPRHAEIQKFCLPFFIDENIRWLQIAMDYQMRVGIMHRAEHLEKQLETVAHTHLLCVAVSHQPGSLDVLQNEKRLSLGGDPGIV